MTWRVAALILVAGTCIGLLGSLWNAPWWVTLVCGAIAGHRILVWFGKR